MKIVIIGNNVSGTFTAQNLRFLSEDIEIEMVTLEKYPYYSRIKLPELISEKVTIDDLIVFNEDWYKDKKIDLSLNTRVNEINTKAKTIQIDGNNSPISYD
jgi:nitrite reductase (NADH) large subunit